MTEDLAQCLDLASGFDASGGEGVAKRVEMHVLQRHTSRISLSKWYSNTLGSMYFWLCLSARTLPDHHCDAQTASRTESQKAVRRGSSSCSSAYR